MEPDPFAAALALLNADDLARLSRSLTWRAGRYRGHGRFALANWHEVVSGIVAGELLTRSGDACFASAPLRQLRQITDDLPGRDRFTLAVEYETAFFDAEAHGLRPPMRLLSVIAGELRRASGRHPMSIPSDVVYLH